MSSRSPKWFLPNRQADFQQPGADRGLPGHESCASGGAALLAIPVGEQCTLRGNAIDIGRLVAHHAVVVGADVELADIIAPDDHDVRLLRVLRRCCAGHAKRERAQDAFHFFPRRLTFVPWS
jgi:hypothetical protein